MTNNRILRTVRMTVFSTLLALMAFSFLAFGSASAHTVSQTHPSQTSSLTQAGKSCPSNTVHMVFAKLGPYFGAFSCHTMTVKVGVPVVIINPTDLNKFVVDLKANIIIHVAPHSTAMLMTTQPGQLHLSIYADFTHPRAQLFVTVVS